MFKMKFLIALSLSVLLLSACGNQTDTSADNQATNNTPKVEAAVEVKSTEEVQELELEVEMETEVAEVIVPEETGVEMVDFETWAKQEGNDEVCLVVWNEELGIQEIMKTWKETNEIYEIRDGDKFAIPFNEIV